MSVPVIRWAVILTGLISVFAWNWNTLLPLYVTNDLGGDAPTYGLIVSLLSVGSVGGAVVSSRLHNSSIRHLLVSGVMASTAMFVLCVAPSMGIAIVGAVMLGAAGTAFAIGTQTRIQLNVTESMAGRVMAIYGVAWVGGRPFGGMLGGWVMDASGPRAAFFMGGAVIGIAMIYMAVFHRSSPDSRD